MDTVSADNPPPQPQLRCSIYDHMIFHAHKEEGGAVGRLDLFFLLSLELYTHFYLFKLGSAFPLSLVSLVYLSPEHDVI